MDFNPAHSLRRMKADRGSMQRTVKTFTVVQVRNFMNAVAANDMRAVPYFAVCFFAGVRPEAALKLKWTDFNSNGIDRNSLLPRFRNSRARYRRGAR